MIKDRYRFSVFTATYNRCNLLPNVYNCLKTQIFKDFEWIIIDDGSNDDTEQVCRSFINEGLFPIKYIKHERNRGKHIAWRTAMNVIEGKYELGADDDDTFPSNTLSIFDFYWSQLEACPNYDSYWEIRARCSFDGIHILGKKLPSSVFDSDYNTVNYILGIGSVEMQGCRKVSILKAEAAVPDHFIYEEYVTNFPEGIRWSRAARLYKTRFVEDIVRVYLKQDEGLTSKNSGNKRSIPKTYNTIVGEIYTLNEQRDLLIKYQKIRYLRVLFVLSYHCFCIKRYAIKYLNNSFDKSIATLFLFIAFFVFLFRR